MPIIEHKTTINPYWRKPGVRFTEGEHFKSRFWENGGVTIQEEVVDEPKEEAVATVESQKFAAPKYIPDKRSKQLAARLLRLVDSKFIPATPKQKQIFELTVSGQCEDPKAIVLRLFKNRLACLEGRKRDLKIYQETWLLRKTLHSILETGRLSPNIKGIGEAADPIEKILK